MPEMFRKNENNQRDRGRGNYKKIFKHLGLWEIKTRPTPRPNALPKHEPFIDYSHRGVGPYGPEADSQLPVSDKWLYVEAEPAYT